jgi:Bacterial type II and III secretion system protein
MPEIKSRLWVRFTIALMCLMLGMPPIGDSQSRRQIKVLVESKQSGTQSQEAVQGSGSVIIRRGNVQPSGRVTGGERQTTIQRSTGIFTLVQDGGESILSVTTRVPYSETAYYYNYAAGNGYLQRNIVFTDVGTSLRVSASVLPDNQIRVRLTPRISYFSTERSGVIDFTEATTEVIVSSGQPLSLGGSTTNMHEITRQILGYRERTSSGETNLVLTATIL